MTVPDDIIHQEILEAAIRLYRRFGPTKVTMDNVATATGRSRSSLYYYFKDRDEIFQAVLERIAEDVAAQIRLKVNAAASLRDKIYAFCLAKISTTEEWKRVFKSMDQLMSADEKSKHSKVQDALHNKLMYLERGILVEALSAAGLHNHAEQDMLAFIISGSIRGVRREIHEYNDPHDAKAAAHLLSEMAAKWVQH